ncbi:MAG: bifunctional phosphoribosylaminoimidazolecarboxamide formyltransferase/IMP cyclohydrolase, partial [Planctomycetota bacterium]
AAAKNHQRVGVVSAVDQYDAVLAAVREGRFDATFRRRLAAAAFERTASYDRAIADYMATLTVESEDDAVDSPFPKVMTATFVDATPLRYGENPHQPAVVYKSPRARADDLTTANVRHGKELSYNNLLDLDAALNLVRDLPTAGAAVLKHNNPCGAGTAETASEAFLKAYSGDPVSAFGSIIALNVPVDVATAEALCEPGRFVECLIAPSFEDAAFELLTTKPTWRKNVRLVELPGLNGERPPRTVLRQITGGVLAQTADEAAFNFDEWKCVTEREPTDAELRDLKFAWAVCRHVKSNAIVFAKDGLATGVGAGQMIRLDSVEIAAKKSDGRAKGGAAASDAFFPFRDGLDQCAAAGVTAVVHPGGSKRDDEVIAAANEHGIAMLLTGVRHFRH